jgi:predicted ribosome quality control (RQC) complex YloA/Tae2 family protein
MPWLGNLTCYLPEDFDQKPAAEQWEDIEKLIENVDRKGFILNQNTFQLEPNVQSESIKQSPIDLCNQLCQWVFTAGEKQKLLLKLQNLLDQARNRTEKELFEIALRLETLEQNPYEKLANNLMANLHQLQNDINRATILDVYANQAIEVKLPEGKTWTSYANQMYQKAKNAAQEVQVLKLRQKHLEEKQKWLLHLEPNQDWSLARMRETEQQLLPPQKSKLATVLPFHEIEMAGFTILIGKNSAANDLLLKNYAKPNDLWLHARDLAGSHVIIKNPAKSKVPQQVIARAAELAAWFSKGKNLSNCPVMVTERKFVRKFNGALKGQVKVEREKTIFAQPKNI